MDMTPTDAEDPRPDLLGGRYRLGELIGRGGMGAVWAANDEVLHRDVAVKEVLAPNWASEEEKASLCERTQREARAAARISHPNVVTVFDVVESDGRPWIVMEKVEARALSKVIDEDGPMSPRRVARIGEQILGALRVAHEHGILHRDVKPGNVLVCADDRAVLTDFGIASVDGDSSLTVSGVLVGAPGYIAPERARGLPFGPASDLWALAATLYAAVEGKAPFDRTGVLPTLTAVLTEEPDPMVLAGPLTPVLEAMLRKEPEDRLSAAEFEQALRLVAHSPDAAADATVAVVTAQVSRADATRTAIHGVLPAAAAGTPWWQRKRGKAAMAAGAAILAGGAVAATLIMLPGRDNPSPPGGPGGGQVPINAPQDTTTATSRATSQRPTSGVSAPSSSPTSTTGEPSSTAPSSTTASSTTAPPTSSQEPTSSKVTTSPPPATTTTTPPKTNATSAGPPGGS